MKAIMNQWDVIVLLEYPNQHDRLHQGLDYIVYTQRACISYGIDR